MFTDPSRTSRILQPSLARTPARLWERSRDESGFGLVEVLVVILVIGVLAAIALPAFLNQKTKAYDAAAKELVHCAAVTAETIAADNNGEYTKVTKAELNKYEPTIQITAGWRKRLHQRNRDPFTQQLQRDGHGSEHRGRIHDLEELDRRDDSYVCE